MDGLVTLDGLVSTIAETHLVKPDDGWAVEIRYIHIVCIIYLLITSRTYPGIRRGAKDRRGSFGPLVASQSGPHNTLDRILVEIGGISHGETLPDPSAPRAMGNWL
jgi:hypothetical protein